ncbi:MAG: NAD(P)/FAD-dependent oxidoreductase [Halolamina sp.]
MRLVVLGAGYAGLTLARRLERRLPAADVVVVDESDEHVLRHEIHRAIRRPAVADAITVPLSEVVDDAEVVVGEVVGVDPEEGRATLADGRTLSWDYGAVCLGSETATYDIPGVADHATPMKELGHAETVREAALAAAADGSVEAVVGGAGLTGVQVAGELAAFAAEEGVRADVHLLEQREDVAPSFPEPFRVAVADALEERGVDVHTDTTVEEATDVAVVVDDDSLGSEGRLAYDTFVWAGGIAGPAAVDGDRPTVRSDLRLGERTFAVGDVARVVDADGEAVPASASAAIREAETAAENIVRLATDDGDGWEPRLDAYRFDVPGWIVSVGDGAVAQVGPQVLTGAPARALKASVGAGYLTSVRAVENAADLVREELGHSADSDDDRPAVLDGGDAGK